MSGKKGKHYCVSQSDIEAIWIMYRSGNYYIKEIALKFAISENTATRIIKEQQEKENEKRSKENIICYSR